MCIIHIYIYEYFGKCFGLFTGASNFLTEMSQLFIIKICFTIKVNSICGAGRDTWNLRHKFNSQGPALRILGLRVAISKSQGPISRVLGVRVPRLRVPGSQGTSSRVSGPEFRLCPSKYGKNAFAASAIKSWNVFQKTYSNNNLCELSYFQLKLRLILN